MIDKDGYRPNVGIVISNRQGQVFWARRVGQDAWQFPQGGINDGETVANALLRELEEEVGLTKNQVAIVGRTKHWLTYDLPENYVRRNQDPVCIGQKQIWYLLELLADESEINFSKTNKPEFDDWRWVDYWYPAKNVVNFKKKVYKKALQQLEPMLKEHLADAHIRSTAKG